MYNSEYFQGLIVEEVSILGLVFAIIALVFLSVYIVRKIFGSPFKYPYFYVPFDVSGKRNPHMSDYIDKYLCNSANWEAMCQHQQVIKKWKCNCIEHIEKSKLKGRRLEQYERALDDDHEFRFEMKRHQKRYRQVNYIKSSYDVYVSAEKRSYSFQQLKDRRNKLARSGFETSLRRYNEAEQRKLMTPQLRRQIMERDHYTCQMCGKYMPDGVGLQIDHIIPVSKGGKTVPSNLRVLCSKCNGKKENKLDDE